MAANAIDWPLAVFPRSAMFHPENQSRTGGASLTGSEQVTVSNAGRWRAKAAGPIVTEESVLAWRAFVSLMEGRAGTVLVPKWENYGVRDANGRVFNEVGGVAFDDGLGFDLSGFGQSDIAYALTYVSAAIGATRIVVDVLSGEGPRPGQYFGIGQRLYMCQAAWSDEDAAVLNVQFWPRLRSAVPAGARVIIDRPTCLMRFASDQTGELELDFGRWANPMVEFVEVAATSAESESVWSGEVATDNLFAGLNFANSENSQYLPAL